MASNSQVPNNPDTDLISPRKRRKIHAENTPLDGVTSPLDHTRWRNPNEQHIYSTKLIHALRNRRRGGGVAVREEADRVLAVAAKGKTRWSRAILTSRLSRRMREVNRKHKREKAANKIRNDRRRRVDNSETTKNVPVLKQKVQVLGRLVPGCRMVSLPKLLEETTDYIEALEMQVRAMTFLAQLLNGTGSGTGSIEPVHVTGPVQHGT